MDAKALLCLMCSFAGLVMIIGGIWLIYKEKIYIDKATNQITELETPIGKFKTNVPALVLFALGFIPLIFPIYKISELLPEIKFDGEVHSNVYPVEVYFVIKTQSLLGPTKFYLNVPHVGEFADYKILYGAAGVVTPGDIPNIEDFERGDLKIHLGTKEIEAAPKLQGKVDPRPDDFRQ
jgi:hypothetical protein